MSFSWKHGRELASVNNAGVSTSFNYNESSIRLKKSTSYGNTVEYALNGDTIMAEKVTPYGGTAYILTYLFDENDVRYGFLYNSTPYYYVTNLQGDVLRIVDAAGNVTASYSYDAYGQILSQSGSMATINPIRYRGYYYDTESGLYYLQSRYYDPVTGRFVNADLPESMLLQDNILATNLFAYCGNNPVMFIDRTGHYATALALSAATTASLGGALAGLMTSISASMVSIKAAIATSWLPIVCIAATAIAIVGITYAVKKIVSLSSAATSTVSAVIAKAKAGGIDPKKLGGETVYVIVRKGTTDVEYVGRTKNYSARYSAHQKRFPSSKYIMMPIATNLTLAQARVMEQSIIMAYTIDTLKNMINSISPSKWGTFKTEYNQMGNLTAAFFDPE